MTLRARLLFFFFPGLLLLFTGLYFAVSYVVKSEETNSVASFALQHLSVISDLKQERFDYLTAKAIHVASLPIFKAALAENSTEQIRTVTDNLLSLPDSALMIVSNSSGKSLYQTSTDQEAGIDLDQIPSIACALKGGSCQTTATINSRIYHLNSIPVKSGNTFWGIMTVGFVYSQPFLQALKSATEYCEITVLDDHCKVSASTLGEKNHAAIQKQCLQQRPEGLTNFSDDYAANILAVDGSHYLSLASPIFDDSHKMVSLLVVHQSLESMEIILGNVLHQFALIGSFILLLLLIADLLMVRGIVRPLEKLVEATGKIHLGHDHLDMETPKNLEARQLTEAINGMLGELVQKTTELQRSSSRYISLINSAHDAIISADAEMNIIVWNKRAEELFGYEEATILGLPVTTLIPPRHQQFHHPMPNNIADGAMLTTMRRRLAGLHRDGHEFPIEINLSKSTARDGSPIFTTIIRDITDQLESEERTRMLTNAIDQSSDMIVITDHEATIRYVNPAFEKTTGFDAGDVIGRSSSILKSGEHGAEFFAKMWQTILSGKVWSGRIVNRRKNGEHYPEEMSISPVIDEQGVIRHFVAIKRDISVQEKMKTQIEHTQRLESLGVLAGGIAHDFNNILTGIMGNASLAERKIHHPENSLVHINRIVDASHRAADLCRQMLAYSGKGQFVIKPVNLSEQVEQIGKLLEVSISKNINLHYRLEQQLPFIEADISQIQQVIMNLITNAAEAIGESRLGEITISTHLETIKSRKSRNNVIGDHAEPGDYACLEVSDTGHGIDRETRSKIFDPFYTTKFTGRGLGLSAVLGIVRGHQGHIELSSEAGQGCSFKVLFPVVDKPAIAEEIKPEVRNHAWNREGTILIVDDEASIREVAQNMITDMGLSTLLANDGKEGVEIFARHHQKISAVILDMTMPRMNGVEAFHAMIAIDSKARVILSSGYNEQDARSRFTDKGLAGFIQKPYTPDMLAAKLQEVLG